MIYTNDNQSPFSTLILSGPLLPVDLEFKQTQITEIFKSNGLPMGRCFGSKSGYRLLHPKCDFIPNANIFNRRDGKVWFGDLDLSRDKPALELIAKRLRCRLHVLDEGDGRFKEASRPHIAVVRDAVWHTGGPTQIPGVCQFFRHSGLSYADAAVLLKLSPRRFNRLQRPEIALEIGRRLRNFDEVFRPIALKAGYRNWGHWWTRPSPTLAGSSPLQALKSGETLDLGKLADATIGLALFAIKYDVMKLL